MSIDISVLKRIIDEEEVIAASIESHRRSNEDLGLTLSLLNKTGWTHNDRRLVGKKMWSLTQAFRDVDESLKIHYSHELNAYSPAFNTTMIASLELDHKILLLKLDRIRELLDGVTDQNVRSKSAKIHKEIDIFCQLLESQNEKDKSMLLWLGNLFEDKKQ